MNSKSANGLKAILPTFLDGPFNSSTRSCWIKRRITPETAKGLAEAFGTSAQLWLNLDLAWQLYKSRSLLPTRLFRSALASTPAFL